MTKDSKIILFAGIILLVVTYLLLYSPLANIFFGIKDGKSVSIPNKSLASLKAKPKDVVILTASMESIKNISIAIPPVSLRNPFGVDFAFEKAESSGSPESAGVQKPQSLFVLQGIFLTDKEHPMALIDDKMLTEGQKIYGFIVRKIYSDQVVLEKGKQVKVLKLKLGVE